MLGTSRNLVYCDIGTFAGPRNRARFWPWKWLTHQPGLIVAVGPEVQEECVSRFGIDPNRVVMIPNGRDPSEFHPDAARSRSDREVTLIYVGALTEQKRPGHFIDIVGKLRGNGYRVRAQLVGTGPLAGSLVNRAQTNGVDLLGFRSDVAQLLRSADVFVFPSLPTGEGMPGVLVEAGLSGVPAVATAVPGTSSVIDDGHTGLIVEGSVPSMTRAVQRLLDDPDLRTAMGVAARNRCTSLFSLDRVADRWRAILQPLAETQR